ncbi:MAG: ComEA family DNA-binding protein [Chloroflexi bacterium]|nr:ComEA family DNA-binding protein [Chloroflexota bacterium]
MWLLLALSACAGEPESIILETPIASATAHIQAPVTTPVITPVTTTTPTRTATARININTADETTLAQLPRIGPTLARRIITYRQQHGLFQSTGDIKNVPGIGNATFEAIKDLIVVE